MIQKVKLTQGQILTKDNLKTYLTRAKSGYDYCKISMKYGTYITVAFFRDNSYDIMTNNRSVSLWNEIQSVRRIRSMNTLIDYMFRWIQVYNR